MAPAVEEVMSECSQAASCARDGRLLGGVQLPLGGTACTPSMAMALSLCVCQPGRGESEGEGEGEGEGRG